MRNLCTRARGEAAWFLVPAGGEAAFSCLLRAGFLVPSGPAPPPGSSLATTSSSSAPTSASPSEMRCIRSKGLVTGCSATGKRVRLSPGPPTKGAGPAESAPRPHPWRCCSQSIPEGRARFRTKFRTLLPCALRKIRTQMQAKKMRSILPRWVAPNRTRSTGPRRTHYMDRQRCNSQRSLCML